MSENTINKALRIMGYAHDEMTGHGFRSLASTLLNEQGWDADAIERQLAHNEEDEVRGAYNHAEHMRLRRKMLQVWADYLDELRAGRTVLPDEYVESKGISNSLPPISNLRVLLPSGSLPQNGCGSSVLRSYSPKRTMRLRGPTMSPSHE